MLFVSMIELKTDVLKEFINSKRESPNFEHQLSISFLKNSVKLI